MADLHDDGGVFVGRQVDKAHGAYSRNAYIWWCHHLGVLGVVLAAFPMHCSLLVTAMASHKHSEGRGRGPKWGGCVREVSVED